MVIPVWCVGRVPLKQTGAYAVSKSAIEMYSDILRLEMKKWDVHVCIIEPQAYKTGVYYFAFCVFWTKMLIILE